MSAVWMLDDPNSTIMVLGPFFNVEITVATIFARLSEDVMMRHAVNLRPQLRALLFFMAADLAKQHDPIAHIRFLRLGLEALGFKVLYSV
jgi:hypothetical protein